MCPIHRKILLMITNFVEKVKVNRDPKERVNSRIVARKTVNKNPNCNHNSNSLFYNHSFSNIKYDDGKWEIEDIKTTDLLWANGEQYNEKEEIKSLKELTLRLFHEPYFGEKRNGIYVMKNKDNLKNKDLASQYSEFEKFFGHEEILIDGYRINK